jgi:chorismate mutase
MSENIPALSRECLRKRRRRAEVAKEEGRLPGKNGRPPIIDEDMDKFIYNKISQDANDGIYHPIRWMLDTVTFFF